MSSPGRDSVSLSLSKLQTIQDKNQTVLLFPNKTIAAYEIRDLTVPTKLNFCQDGQPPEKIAITRIMLPFVDDPIDLFGAISDELGDTEIVDQVSITTGRDSADKLCTIPQLFVFVSHEEQTSVSYVCFERIFMAIHVIMFLYCLFSYYRENILDVFAST